MVKEWLYCSSWAWVFLGLQVSMSHQLTYGQIGDPGPWSPELDFHKDLKPLWRPRFQQVSMDSVIKVRTLVITVTSAQWRPRSIHEQAQDRSHGCGTLRISNILLLICSSVASSQLPAMGTCRKSQTLYPRN